MPSLREGRSCRPQPAASDRFQLFSTIGNIANAHAPLFANTAYTSQTNYLTSWHAASLVGRTLRAGANIKF